MAHADRIDVKEFAAEITGRLRALRGARTEQVRNLRREYSRRLRRSAAGDVVDLAVAVFEPDDFLGRFVAYELVCHHRAALQSLGTRELKLFGRGLDRWEAVDTFACYLAGPAWRRQQVPDQLIHRWAGSPSRWWRRLALVCTVALNNKARGGHGDTERTLAVCRLLLSDRDDMVVKAMSWALRELAKRDPDAVRRFLTECANDLAARVVREVRNKLATGLKNPKRQGNSG
jgi:3-methyladenine DNA glycosylase AlkD